MIWIPFIIATGAAICVCLWLFAHVAGMTWAALFRLMLERD